ncbi:MAG: PIN domain-containing protein, partial [Bacteroidota bacterium]
VINEYVEVLEEKVNGTVAENIANLLLRSPDTEQVEVYFCWSVIAEDADDNKFVDCALNSQADFIVTDDKHFNVLRKIGFPPVNVIRTEEFLREIKKLEK